MNIAEMFDRGILCTISIGCWPVEIYSDTVNSHFTAYDITQIKLIHIFINQSQMLKFIFSTYMYIPNRYGISTENGMKSHLSGKLYSR